MMRETQLQPSTEWYILLFIAGTGVFASFSSQVEFRRASLNDLIKRAIVNCEKPCPNPDCPLCEEEVAESEAAEQAGATDEQVTEPAASEQDDLEGTGSEDEAEPEAAEQVGSDEDKKELEE